MKLYSRGQVAVIAALSAVGALVAGGAVVVSVDVIARASAGARSPVLGAEQLSPDLKLQTSAPAGTPFAVESGVRYDDEESQNIAIYQRVNAAVVNISTENMALNWFLEPVPEGGGIGSGSIIDKRGYVLTNYHVVAKAYKVTVTLADGQQFAGKVIGSDPESDLAVVKFDPGSRSLVTVPLGTAKNLKVGQRVLAIGNPFGLSRTLTTGIVSGLGRPIQTDNGLVLRNMIQTDASINPGNSGGPLLDSQGLMIGINTMIYTPSGGSVGIGFATPVDTARRVLPDLIKFGLVRRGWIDLIPVQLDGNVVRFGRLPVARGLLVSRVIPGGNAEAAGIRGGDPENPVRYGQSIIYFGGDIIVAVNGLPVASIGDYFTALERTRPGETVPVDVLRDGRRLSLSVTLDHRPTGLTWE